jgi:hypothetical protein
MTHNILVFIKFMEAIMYMAPILLYEGKTIKQTFRDRIPQHNRHFNKDYGYVKVEIDRLHEGKVKSF